MKIIKFLFALIAVVLIFLLCAAFLTSNTESVRVDLLFVPVVEARLGVVLMVFFIAGGLIGLLTSGIALIKLKTEKVRLERRLKSNSQIISGFNH